MKISLNDFTKNIFLVFAGSSLVNFINLLCQLLVAHKFSPADFSAFNSLISVFMILSVPLLTIQTAVAKYGAQYAAGNDLDKVRFLLGSFLKKSIFLAVLTLTGFYWFSLYIVRVLNINSPASVYILSLLFVSCWVTPVMLGGAQGLELFGWFISASVAGSILKLALIIIIISVGLSIAMALGAFLSANILVIAILFFGLRNSISFKDIDSHINFKGIFLYLFPIAFSLFCFMVLVNVDMILVRYFFTSQDAGFYSIAQMIGKIFLFMPAAISVVLLPRTSALSVKNIDSMPVLRRSLLFASAICALSWIVYNIFPDFFLKILTGKDFSESVRLGRLFGISMSFFSLSYIFITYFISRKDKRFIKYIALSVLFQVSAIAVLHRHILDIQLILCVNAVLLFLVNCYLAFKKEVVCE